MSMTYRTDGRADGRPRLTRREMEARLAQPSAAEQAEHTAWLARVEDAGCLCVHRDATACAASHYGCAGDCACHGAAS